MAPTPRAVAMPIIPRMAASTTVLLKLTSRSGWRSTLVLHHSDPRRLRENCALSGPSALVVLTSRLRDPVQCSGGFRQRALKREIAQRDDTDEPLISVHYRETPYLQLRHVLNHVHNFFILKAIFNLLAHCILNHGIRPLFLDDTADRNVAIGDHPD